MLCTECQKRTATTHITNMENGQKTEEHLCDICAAKRHHFDVNPDLALDKFFSGFFAKEKPESQLRELLCPNCGLTYRQLASKGNFGCATCYQVFSSQLQQILGKIQAAERHVGKTPLSSAGNQQKSTDMQVLINDLRRQMAEWVRLENFEEAAILRDRIKNLEQKAGDANV
jgi:protein arginine kinase activator